MPIDLSPTPLDMNVLADLYRIAYECGERHLDTPLNSIIERTACRLVLDELPDTYSTGAGVSPTIRRTLARAFFNGRGNAQAGQPRFFPGIAAPEPA